MALTATATPSTREYIMKNLCMEKDSTLVIDCLPNKTNIRYEVHQKPQEIANLLRATVTDVRANGREATKTIIFCRTYPDFSEVMTNLVSELTKEDCLYVKADDGERPLVWGSTPPTYINAFTMARPIT